MMRLSLGNDPQAAGALADQLTARLDEIWSHDPKADIDLQAVIAALNDDTKTLTDWQAEYLRLKSIDPDPIRTAVSALRAVAGDKDIRSYDRRDARRFVHALEARGLRSGTIRRRIASVSAVLNFAYLELDHDRRNPFSSLLIAHEGKDRQQREPFTTEELARAYEAALTGTSRLRLCVPILGETGCRIAEVIGLRKQDVDLRQEKIGIVGHPSRTLKTSGSEREIPLVGVALEAANRLMIDSESDFLFPAYTNDTICKATHASNALNKWLKREFGGKTAHCLRHAFRDRLRAAECPLELIDALGGWSSVGTAGSRYGRGFDLEHKRNWLRELLV